MVDFVEDGVRVRFLTQQEMEEINRSRPAGDTIAELVGVCFERVDGSGKE